MKPIKFTEAMLEQILVGIKTETRQLLRPQSLICGEISSSPFVMSHYSPHGKPGDRLFVQEEWALLGMEEAWTDCGWESDEVPWQGEIPESKPKLVDKSGYRVSWHPVQRRSIYGREIDSKGAEDRGFEWLEADTMPEWAARVVLEVTRVSVENVQNITILGAINEGVLSGVPTESVRPGYFYEAQKEVNRGRTPPLGPGALESFQWLWKSLYPEGEFSWASDPWVWVYEFKRIKP